MKTDIIFYRLFQEFPNIFFELISQPELPADTYQFTSVELKQLAFHLDGLFLPPPNQPNLPMYFVEVQFFKKMMGFTIAYLPKFSYTFINTNLFAIGVQLSFIPGAVSNQYNQSSINCS